MLRDVAYQSRTTDFWDSCDGLGGAGDLPTRRRFNDGKGEPIADQRRQPRLSAGAVPADQCAEYRRQESDVCNRYGTETRNHDSLRNQSRTCAT